MTLLTRTSVHCAERIVATSNSSGVRKSSEQAASGYARHRPRTTLSAYRFPPARVIKGTSPWETEIGGHSDRRSTRLANGGEYRSTSHQKLWSRPTAVSSVPDRGSARETLASRRSVAYNRMEACVALRRSCADNAGLSLLLRSSGTRRGCRIRSSDHRQVKTRPVAG